MGNLKISCPLSGTLLPITEVPDQVFSQKMMGDGFAVDPSCGEVVSPVTGTVTMIFPTNHAIGIKTDDGYEILIHVGIDTVELKGEGMDSSVKEKQKVKAGDLLLTFDMERIKGKVPSLITSIVFTNLQDKEVKLLKTGSVKAGDPKIVKLV